MVFFLDKEIIASEQQGFQNPLEALGKIFRRTPKITDHSRRSRIIRTKPLFSLGEIVPFPKVRPVLITPRVRTLNKVLEVQSTKPNSLAGSEIAIKNLISQVDTVFKLPNLKLRRLIRETVSQSGLNISCPKRKLIGIRGFQVSHRIDLLQNANIQRPFALTVANWLEEVVRPSAQRYFGISIVKLRVAASFACRTRNNLLGAKLSEHGLGNAIDISAFILANGREIEVLSGWRGKQLEQFFLKRVYKGKCSHFTTVLAPNADKYHYNYFHFDLASHGRDGRMRICR